MIPEQHPVLLWQMDVETALSCNQAPNQILEQNQAFSVQQDWCVNQLDEWVM